MHDGKFASVADFIFLGENKMLPEKVGWKIRR